MRALAFAILLALLPGVVWSQATPPVPSPDECYRFAFSAWDPPLKNVANTYNPGYDPTTSAPPGAPRDWATRVGTGTPTGTPSDSVLLLFPAWWPSGVSIEWQQQHGDTLIGRAIALVADGRVKNPVSSVRATRLACRKPHAARADTSLVRDP